MELSRHTPWPEPLRSARGARGARVELEGGGTILDLSFAPLLGHGHPAEVAAARAALESGLTYARHEAAARVVGLLGRHFPVGGAVQLFRTGRDALAAAPRSAPVHDWTRLAFRVTDPPPRDGVLALALDLAGGLTLGALIGPDDRLTAPDPAALSLDPLALAAAAASLEELERVPAAPRIARAGERLRSAFAAACGREKIAASLEGPPGLMELRFAGQEETAAAVLHQRFLEELRAEGALAGATLRPCAALDAGEDLEAAARALDRAVTRLRARLVERDSFLGERLPWVFPGAEEPFRAAGLGVYRYPRDAAVEVAARGDSVRIAFAPGAVGDVISSGFYVPVALEGDFTATVRYRLGPWSPGRGAAMLGLFAQDGPSTVRYYAQLASEGEPARFAAQAALAGRIDPAQRATAEPGAFRLVREGASVSAWHDSGAGWRLLGERADDARAPLVIGCKVWAHRECAGLVAELTGLTLRPGAPRR
jgi:hypothetical protein